MGAYRRNSAGRLRSTLLAAIALLLVLAQAGALAHGYSHYARSQPRDAGAAHGPVLACADCAAFAPLLGAAGASAPPAMPVRLGPSRLALPVATDRTGTQFHAAYRSRAPPLAA